MTELRGVGFWKGPGEPKGLIHPRLLVRRDWELARRDAVVRYLDSGQGFMEMLGYSHCRFEGGPPPNQMGNSTLTDGVWAWPEGLSVYVRLFDVALPNEFVAHMASRAFVPDIASPKTLESATIDIEWWIAWCRANRHGPWHRLRARFGVS